jgi:NAD(P)-dependent dehydrogenase (short-subunit alcohol dehydrogenase family)
MEKEGVGIETLAGKVALVTGGGKGIGRGVARRFVRDGAIVVVAEIDRSAGEAIVDELVEQGGKATFVHTDVSKKADVLAAVSRTIEEHQRLDILVNNAITLSPNVKLEEKTDEMLEGLLRVGLWATWWAMQAALVPMRAQGGGRIINFYSIDAESGAWLHADYNATKEAVRALTRSAAVEWARFNIQVNAIAPGAASTIFEQMCVDIPGFRERAAAMNPSGRVGDPEHDIAPVVAFLASDDARYVTGETIHVDGGQHLPRYDTKPPDVSAGVATEAAT